MLSKMTLARIQKLLQTITSANPQLNYEMHEWGNDVYHSRPFSKMAARDGDIEAIIALQEIMQEESNKL